MPEQECDTARSCIIYYSRKSGREHKLSRHEYWSHIDNWQYFIHFICHTSWPSLRVQQLVTWDDGRVSTRYGCHVKMFNPLWSTTWIHLDLWLLFMNAPQVVFIVECFPLGPSPQMPGSSGTTQSMKKTIGHRGVETTTGETTYKKVRTVWGVSDTSLLTTTTPRSNMYTDMFCVYILKIVWKFLSLRHKWNSRSHT